MCSRTYPQAENLHHVHRFAPHASRTVIADHWIFHDGRHASLAHSTHASFLRQLGWHDEARGWDGRALALAGTDSEARADALIGLAADALGVGRFGPSAAALRSAESLLDLAPPRLRVRLAWVS